MCALILQGLAGAEGATRVMFETQCVKEDTVFAPQGTPFGCAQGRPRSTEEIDSAFADSAIHISLSARERNGL